MKNFFLFISILILIACSSKPLKNHSSGKEVKIDTLQWYDDSRGRDVPIAIYQPIGSATTRLVPIIVNHGYGANKGGDYMAYSGLAKGLAQNGYFVVSIQHELLTDSLMPLIGDIKVVRRPFWERGADNIYFVIKEMKRKYPELIYKELAILGHSNGGDMCALFSLKYPMEVSRIITLDNRRVALPRTINPKVYSLRSSDQPADEGVLPTMEEQKKFGIQIVKLPATIHNDMDDSGTAAQQKEILDYVLKFMK